MMKPFVLVLLVAFAFDAAPQPALEPPIQIVNETVTSTPNGATVAFQVLNTSKKPILAFILLGEFFENSLPDL